MDVQTAMACLAAPDRKLSEVGEAVDVLYREYGAYSVITEKVNSGETRRSPAFLSSRHRIFQLPKGIRWKVDEKHISVTQAYQISRLENEEDQWLLAISIVEKNLNPSECENVVNLALNQDRPIREALSIVTGVRFEEISPPVLLLPVGVDFWFDLIRSAWSQGKNWEDLCYQFIREGIDVDLKDVAIQLESLALALREAGQRKGTN